MWTVTRNSEDEYAEAIAGEGDSIQTLAEQIGLSVAQAQYWLSVQELPPVDEVVPKGTSWKVPNTIIAYWGGDLGAAGQLWVDWNGDIDSLKDKGFLVEELHFKPNFIYRSDSSGPSSKKPTKRFEWKPVKGGSDEFELMHAVMRYTLSKKLHGLFYWGHGSPHGLIVKDGPTGSWQLLYDHARPLYGLAWVKLCGCFSDKGKPCLCSNTLGHTWEGFDGMLIPLGPIAGNIDSADWKMLA